jgi:hypothetical protein
LFEFAAHHEKWYCESSNDQRYAEDESDAGAFAQGETDNQSSDKQKQTNSDGERKTVGTVETLPCFLSYRFFSPHW